MNDKNLFSAFLLIAAFLICWSAFVVPRFSPPPPASVGAAPASTMTATPASAPMTAAPEASPRAQPQAAALSSETTLQDPQNEIVFTARGGAVRHWRLHVKGQQVDLVENASGKVTQADPDKGTLQIQDSAGQAYNFTVTPDILIYAQGKIVKLPELQEGEQVSVEHATLPLTTFPDAVFKTSVQDRRITMETTLPNGLQFRKTLTLASSGFLNEMSLQWNNPTAQPVELKDWEWGWGPGMGTSSGEYRDNNRMIRALLLGPLRAHKLKPGNYDEEWRWAGIDNRYFLVAFIPEFPDHPLVVVSGQKDDTRTALRQTVTVPPHGQAVFQYGFYAGPKGYTHLQHYGQGLEEAVDFGFFSFLGKWMLRFMVTLEQHTGNYGWAIVLMTIILQICMSPLTIKSFKSAIAMKHLQPQIAALQKNYKEDPKRLNMEMMNLYKKSGTNPFGGCLPMLLQLPIFWALFTTLRNAYELRGAPFTGWIHDLSAPDVVHSLGGIHVLPFLMGGSLFLQQRMSGATADPTQRQMMMMMPVMMTVMFWSFPSGLVLYYFVNNMLAMSFQFSYQRYTQSRTASSQK